MLSLKTRASSLLRSTLRHTNKAEPEKQANEKHLGPSSSSNPEPLTSEKPPPEENASLPEKRLSLSSAEKTTNPPGDLAVTEGIQSQRLVRPIPTWIHVFDEDGDRPNSPSNPLPFTPPIAQVACHNNSPSVKQKNKADPPRGRLFDSQREWITPTPRAPFSEDAPKWREFARSSTYPTDPDEDGEIVTEAWLIQNGGDYSRPWLATSENGDIDSEVAHFLQFPQRKVWWKRLQRTVLHSPIIPVVFRMVVWCFSLVALILGSSILKTSINSESPHLVNSPSPNMAIIVDGIALVYIIYITYDEYTGKPLGLRSAKAKIRLIFLDLFFIVFDSANLSLAFGAVLDSDVVCVDGKLEHVICSRQTALASVLLIALIAWLLTFSVSVLRLIERVTGR